MLLFAVALLMDESLPIVVDQPVFACREFLVGPVPTQPGGIWLQLAFRRVTEMTYDSGNVIGNQDMFQNFGYASVEVTEADVAGKPCRRVKWRSIYRPPNKGIEDVWTQYWFVTVDGTLLRYTVERTGTRGSDLLAVRKATVTFTNESAFIQRTVGTNRQSFELPYQGNEEAARNLFKPIYVDGKVTQYEKKIAFVDPFESRWILWTVRHRSKWNGTVNQKVVGGQAFDFETPKGYFSTYLLPDAQIFDVRFNEKHRYIPDELVVKPSRN
jgi:hypothetical protein